MMLRYLEVSSASRCEMVDVTRQVQEAVTATGVAAGICCLFVLHTTAGITVNEGADPDVRRDMTAFLGRLIPHDGGFRHAEGNSDAHIKASLVGLSVMVPVAEGRLVLGTWQSVYLCEFDGPRRRRIALKVMAG